MTSDPAAQYPHNLPEIETLNDALVLLVSLIEWGHRAAPASDAFGDVRESLEVSLAEYARDPQRFGDFTKQAGLLREGLQELRDRRYVVKYLDVAGVAGPMGLPAFRITCWATLDDALAERQSAGQLLSHPTAIVVL